MLNIGYPTINWKTKQNKTKTKTKTNKQNKTNTQQYKNLLSSLIPNVKNENWAIQVQGYDIWAWKQTYIMFI